MVMFLIYAFLISFLFGSSIKEKPFIRFGILVFVISDALLMVNIGLGTNIILGILQGCILSCHHPFKQHA